MMRTWELGGAHTWPWWGSHKEVNKDKHERGNGRPYGGFGRALGGFINFYRCFLKFIRG